MTLSLSLTFEPPRTATNGRVGCSRRPSSTSTSRGEEPPGALRQVLRRADDRGVGAVRRAEGVVHVGVEAVDEPRDEGRVVGLLPGSNRRFSSSSTPGASSASRARIGATEYAVVGRALRPAEVGAPRRPSRPAPCSHSMVGSAARMRRSSVMAPSCTGTLKSARSRTRWPSSGGEVLEGGDAEGGHAEGSA